MRACRRCGGEVEDVFRFCPWCGERRRMKLVEFFRPHPDIDAGRSLRVSRYLGPRSKDRHVRFSVWSQSRESARAEAAVSLDEAEATRLALFLVDPVQQGRPRTLLEAVRAVRGRLGARAGG
jgi:hypothetical protein